MFRFSILSYDEKHGDITQRFRSVLFDWWMEVRDWDREVLSVTPEDTDGEYYLRHSHRFTLEGVLDVL